MSLCLQSVVPCRFRSDKQLVSHDTHSNTYNYKYTFSVEIAPVCKVGSQQRRQLSAMEIRVLALVSPDPGGHQLLKIARGAWFRQRQQPQKKPWCFLQLEGLECQAVHAIQCHSSGIVALQPRLDAACALLPFNQGWMQLQAFDAYAQQIPSGKTPCQ